MLNLLRRGLSAINPARFYTYAASTANFSPGSNQYGSVADNASLDVTSEITLAAWVKFDTRVNSGIITKYDSGANARSYALGYSSGSSKFIMSVDGDGLGTSQFTSITADTLGTPNTGQWYHVAVTLSGTTLSIYIDGSLDTSTTHTHGIHAGTSEFDIGGYTGGAALFGGDIAFAGLWDNGLSSGEISTLYNGGDALCYGQLSGALKTNLVSYWHLADFTGHTTDETTDQHGSNNLTNNGSFGFTGTGLDVEC